LSALKLLVSVSGGKILYWYLKERDFIWDMLSFTVSDENWDDDLGWYDQEEVPMLDMKSVLNSDRVLLLDTGELRGEST